MWKGECSCYYYRPPNEVCEGYVFYTCLSVILFTGGHAWQEGGMHGGGACVAGGLCFVGDMHGRGACMVGGVHGRGACLARGCAWWGACVAGDVCSGEGMHGRGACVVGGMHGTGVHATHAPRQILRPRHMVNERAVRILLECVLVLSCGHSCLVQNIPVLDINTIKI